MARKVYLDLILILKVQKLVEALSVAYLYILQRELNISSVIKANCHGDIAQPSLTCQNSCDFGFYQSQQLLLSAVSVA